MSKALLHPQAVINIAAGVLSHMSHAGSNLSLATNYNIQSAFKASAAAATAPL